MFKFLSYSFEFLVLVGMSVGFYMLYIKEIKPKLEAQKLVKDPDKSMEKLVDGLEILHLLFGPKVSVTTQTTAAGRMIAVACRKYQKENRLVRGFNGAVCGNCKHPLVVQRDEFKASN